MVTIPKNMFWIKKKISVLHYYLSHWGFPCGSAGKESTCNAGDLDSIPGLGRSPGEGNSYPLQYSGLENSMDYRPWGHEDSDMTKQLSLSLLSLWWRCQSGPPFYPSLQWETPTGQFSKPRGTVIDSEVGL